MATKTKKKPKRAPRASKVKQTVLPDMEPHRIPEIEGNADEYVGWMEKRMAAGRQEKALKDKIMAAMHDAGEKVYVTEGNIKLELTHEEKENLKVSRNGSE